MGKLIGAKAICEHTGMSEATLMDQIIHAGFPARNNDDGEWETTTAAVAKIQSPPLSKEAKEAKKKVAVEATAKK